MPSIAGTEPSIMCVAPRLTHIIDGPVPAIEGTRKLFRFWRCRVRRGTDSTTKPLTPGGTPLEFSFEQVDQDLFLIDKQYRTLRPHHGSDISGPYWMLIEIGIHQGQIWWLSDRKKIAPVKESCLIFVPPYSWAMENYEANTFLRVRGLISKGKPPILNTSGPVLFYSALPFPKTTKQVSALLAGIDSFESIGANTRPSSLSERAKRLIDEHHHRSIEIQEIALSLRSNPAALSRKFKADFGETPAYYRKGLRITVGMYELLMGTPAIEAAHIAGYKDLSRFYKQFKSYLKQTPSEYFKKKSKNAKN